MKAQELILRLPKLRRADALRHPRVALLASELQEEPPDLLLSTYLSLSVQLESYVGCQAWPEAFQGFLEGLKEDMAKDHQELQAWQALLSAAHLEIDKDTLRAARALVRSVPFGGLINDAACNVVLLEGDLRALRDLEVGTRLSLSPLHANGKLLLWHGVAVWPNGKEVLSLQVPGQGGALLNGLVCRGRVDLTSVGIPAHVVDKIEEDQNTQLPLG